MMDNITNNIDRFKDFVSRWRDCYRFAVFSYVALKRHDSGPVIVSSKINLVPVLDTSKLVLFTHDSQSVIGGITYWEINDDPLGFLSRIDEGLIVVQSNGETLQLQLCDKEGFKDIGSQFDSGINLTKNSQPRTVSLSIIGYDIDTFFQKAGGLDELDCELRSSPIPFDGLGDLISALGINKWSQSGHKSELVIYAHSIIVLERTKSSISDGTASIYCEMAPGLPRDQLLIGIRPWDGDYSGRKSISGVDLQWTEEDGIAKGSIDNLTIKDVHAVLVFLSHSSTIFDRFWISDLHKHINPAYAVYQTIDENLAQL